jgi:hypothetical protein
MEEVTAIYCTLSKQCYEQAPLVWKLYSDILWQLWHLLVLCSEKYLSAQNCKQYHILIVLYLTPFYTTVVEPFVLQRASP